MFTLLSRICAQVKVLSGPFHEHIGTLISVDEGDGIVQVDTYGPNHPANIGTQIIPLSNLAKLPND